MSKRNIYFYSLKITHTVLIDGTPLKEELSKEDVYGYLRILYDDLPANTEGFKYLKHTVAKDEYFLIEFIDFNQDSTFIRLGKPSQNNEVGKRNVQSCDLKEIPLENAELIESYTYLYIDFNTDVVSFVRVGNAPSVKWFAIPITAYNPNSGYTISCVPFTTEEILDSIGTNAEIGSITITTVKPTMEISEHLRGLNEKDKDDLDSTDMTMSLSIKPKKKGGLTTSSKAVIARLFNKLKGNEEGLKKFAINIADEMDEKKSIIDLMNYRFIRTSDILSTDKLTVEQYKEEIIKVYQRELMNMKRIFKF